jgi:hypothetical protein
LIFCEKCPKTSGMISLTKSFLVTQLSAPGSVSWSKLPIFRLITWTGYPTTGFVSVSTFPSSGTPGRVLITNFYLRMQSFVTVNLFSSTLGLCNKVLLTGLAHCNKVPSERLYLGNKTSNGLALSTVYNKNVMD